MHVYLMLQSLLDFILIALVCVYNSALLWPKEASLVTKGTFLVKQQNVSVISTDVNGIS